MQNTLIARTFALAFYNVISNNENKEEIFTQYHSLVESIQNQKNFGMFLETPRINRLEKKDFFEKTLRNKFNDLLIDFLQIITSKGYLSKVVAIYHEMKDLDELQGNKVKICITTAICLNDEVKKHLLEALEKKFNAQVILVEKVDPSILGGFIFQVEDTLVDGSIKLHLEKIGNCILERSKTYGI